MSALLDEAINQLRELPEEEQDAAADALFAYIASDERQYSLEPHHAPEVRRIKHDLANGGTRLATSDEVAGLRRKVAR